MMNSERKLLGWTLGQWWTVLSNYPPSTFDFRGLHESRYIWKNAHNFEPVESPITKKFEHHWEKFCNTLNRIFGREP